MKSETRQCQNCKSQFTIEPEDFDFFEQMKVAPPELCSECGVARVMSFRNERHLYKGQCAKCQKTILSMYHSNSPYVVYCHDCWWKDDWDGLESGLAYDSKRPLLNQFAELQRKVPREALIIINSTNCDYGNHVRSSKDVYFSYLVALSENILYSTWISNNTKDCLTSTKVVESQLVAYSIDVSKCYSCAFLQDSADCSDCYFSYDLRGCTNCLFSSNLRNKSYYVFNQQVSKEEYEKIKKEIFDGSFKSLAKQEEKYATLRQGALRRYAFMLNSSNTEGNFIERCNECHWCFDGFNTQDTKSVASILNAKRGMYSYSIGTEPVEFFFGCSVIKGGSNLRYCFNLANGSDCTYCDSLIGSSNCIASVGLKHKEYCILNKQYSKEEYQKIKNVLEERGELKNMPPPSFSTFAYNETVAYDHYPMTKGEALSRGYGWQDDAQQTIGQETIQPETLPDNIKDTNDDIVKEILRCIMCSRNYRITPAELALYRRFNLPLSRTCPQCRFAQRRKERLPYRLWKRDCMCQGEDSQKGTVKNTASHFHGTDHCPNTFQTSYAPGRPEVVYCEQCYNSEVV